MGRIAAETDAAPPEKYDERHHAKRGETANSGWGLFLGPT
jgi:hypothetical protein